jgi:ABC-type amino acid transport substrate-binding protein
MLAGLLLALPALAVEGESGGAGSTLVVGTKEAPPFAMRQADGSWRGITIDLWRNIADELKLEYRFEETDLPGLLAGVGDGRFDAGAAAISVTAKREAELDFSHPFYISGLSIAVPLQNHNAWLAVVKGFFTLQFVQVVLALLALLFLIGVFVWLFEHKRNTQFSGPGLNGVGSGFWWSAVTMTTVGYGDKAPVTLGGRLVALVWMFASIIIISSFTAAIASALTVGQLGTSIEGPQDLYQSRTGTIADSSSEAYLNDRQIGFEPYGSAREGLQALANGEIDAFVYDQPLLKYLAATAFKGQIQVLPGTFRREDYAFLLPADSALRQSVNEALLRQLESLEWKHIVTRYLGPEDET